MKKNLSNIKKAINYLNNDDCIAIPTETVYGLAGNAYSYKATSKIFKLKKRPKKNPLIVHYYNLSHAKKDVVLDKKFFKIYKKFSPGPVTYIVRKKSNSKIKPLACANLKTVGIRFPKNQIARKILKKLSFPLVMPSANKSSSISSVKPLDVSKEFNNKIKVVDGGISAIGIESTVLNLVNNVCILRPGVITPKQIEKVLKKKVNISSKQKTIKSPGYLKKHYSPGIPMYLNKKNAQRDMHL